MAAAKICEIEHEEDLEDFAVEIDILSECKHENIVQLLEAYTFENKLWVCSSRTYLSEPESPFRAYITIPVK